MRHCRVVDLIGRQGWPVGYRGKHHTAVIDVDKRAAQEVFDFWEPLYNRGSADLILDPDEFYILVARGCACAAALRRRDDAVRSAGRRVPGSLCRFFRSGFRTQRRPAVGKPRRARGAQPRGAVRSRGWPDVGRLVYERMGASGRAVRAELKSNYQAQGLKLSKHFRS
jgi:dCTP deaminase